MINIDHKSAYAVIPVVFFAMSNIIHQNRILYFGNTFMVKTVMDLSKLLGSFLVPFVAFWIPWVTHPIDFANGIYKIFIDNNGHHVVSHFFIRVIGQHPFEFLAHRWAA
jgi:hypothetical protein